MTLRLHSELTCGEPVALTYDELAVEFRLGC